VAKYQARPEYVVQIGDNTIVFDYFGVLETEDATTIAGLDKLCPVYMQRIDQPQEQKKWQEEPKGDKPMTRRKPLEK